MGMLADLPVFRDLPAAAQARLEGAGTVLDLGDGARVFARGEQAGAVYAVLGGNGSVRIGVMDRRGKSLMVEVFRAGDLFGEIAVIDRGTRTADAVVAGRLRILRIGAASFLDVLATTPELGVALSRMLAARIRRTGQTYFTSRLPAMMAVTAPSTAQDTTVCSSTAHTAIAA